MRQPYFRKQEIVAFVVGTTEQIKLTSLALAGDLLNEKDSAELEGLREQPCLERPYG